MTTTIPVQDNHYEFEGYFFSTDGLKFETYDDEWHHGIIYYCDEGQFDISLNKIGWPRIIIRYAGGSWNDVPFNDRTIELLPKTIKVRKL